MKKLRLFQHFPKLQPNLNKMDLFIESFSTKNIYFFLSESCFHQKYICFFSSIPFHKIWGHQPVLSTKRAPVRHPGRGCPIATAFGEVATTGLMAERVKVLLGCPV